MLRFFATVAIVILLILAVVGGTAAGLFYLDRDKISKDLQTQTNLVTQHQTKITALEGEIMELKEGTPASTTPDSCFSKSVKPRIVINQPCQNSEITKSVKVTGAAFGLFEAVMDYELLVDGAKVTSGFIDTGIATGEFGYLDKTITLNYPDSAKGKEAVLRFFETSAADGSQQNTVDIKAKLK